MALLHDVGLVEVRDTMAFTAWLVWAHTVPGVVLWRALDWRAPVGSGRARPFPEDVALGSILGIIVAIPAYLLAVAAGLPLLVAAWPLLVLVPAALSRRGRVLLLRRQARPTPPWWSWSLAAVMLFAVGFSAVDFWGEQALTPESLRGPYVDVPFHLSLVGEFRHHFPATMPYVSGTPLRYHWLVYPFLASSSWGAGVEPHVLLQLLGPAALGALMLLGVAAAATRLSGHRWAGVAAAALACAVSPLDVMGWSRGAEPWISPSWAFYISPTQALANALAPLLVVLVVAVARGAATRPRHWLLTAVVLLAVAGAKSAMPPLFVAGLFGATVVMVLLRRRAAWRLAGLTVLSVGVFALATAIFYGRGSRALTLEPLQYVDFRAAGLGLAETDAAASGIVQAVMTAALVLCVAAPAVGALGLFSHGGWRRPVPWLLLGTWAAGIGVLLLMRHPGLGQYYFYASGVVPVVLLAALGWARAVGHPSRAKVTVVGAALLVGLGWAVLVSALTSSEEPLRSASTDAGRMLASFGLPLGIAVSGVLVLTAAFHLGSRRSAALRGQSLLVAISLVVGMCLPYPLATVATFRDGAQPPRSAARIPVREGGLEAATWLREHSSPDDLVATNVHTQMLSEAASFDHRNFWISAYSERRVLVEGWAYIAPEVVGLPSTDANNAAAGPAEFWDPELLRLNDEAFTAPTAARLEELHRRHGVDWLFVDKGRDPDLEALGRLADVRLETEQYAVVQLRP